MHGLAVAGEKTEKLSLARALVFQLFASGLIGCAIVFLGHYRNGADGLWAGIVAAFLAGVAAIGALSLAVFSHRLSPVSVALAGTFVRIGVPLVGGMVTASYYPDLAAAGLMGLVVVCYLLNLVTETFLSLKVLVGRSEAKV